MYTIGQIIFGVPWTKELETKVEEYLEQHPELYEEYEAGDFETLGFESAYTGHCRDVKPGWLGECYADIDEVHHVNLTELLDNIQQEHSTKFAGDYAKKLEQVPEFLRPMLPEPKLWIIWSTS